MLTITSESFHEKLYVGNEEIILNGPPTDLRGHIFIRNTHSESMRVKSLSLVHNNKMGVMKAGDNTPLRISCRLKPGEEKMESLSYQVAPHTPPGNYETSLMVGGEMRKLRLVVQTHIAIDVYPQNFTCQDTSPGKIHAVEFTLTNLGNMPFQVPEVKHIATLDMDFLCRAFGFGFRDKGAEGYMPTMDQITRNVKNSLPDWSSASAKEIGKIAQPGESMIIHMEITLPANSDPKKDYSGTIRFWDKNLAFVIKSHNEKMKK